MEERGFHRCAEGALRFDETVDGQWARELRLKDDEIRDFITIDAMREVDPVVRSEVVAVAVGPAFVDRSNVEGAALASDVNEITTAVLKRRLQGRFRNVIIPG